MKVFIVVLNWNGKKDTLECLQSIEKLDTFQHELNVVLVDNASTDGSISAFKKLKPENFSLKILESKKNLGFAGGNNLGIKYALGYEGDYILILNNDTTVSSDLLIQFIKEAEENPRAGIFSPKIYFAPGFEFHKERYKKEDKGRVIWYSGGKIDWNNVYGFSRGVDEVDSGQYDKVEETDFATGTCMFISRKVLKEVGMFDEKYFMYYEDTELSVRAKKAEFKVMYVPGATLWHKVARSSAIGSELNDYFTTRNRMLFGIKYAKLRTKIALVKESIKLLLNGRKWQKVGIKDFYLSRFGKGSWK